MTENYYQKIAIKNVIFFLLTIKLATFALFYCKKKNASLFTLKHAEKCVYG